MTTELRLASVIAVGALLITLTGCPGRNFEPAPGRSVGARTGWATKEVVGKREPETLVAADGTICRVAPDRFASTKVRDRTRCNWQ